MDIDALLEELSDSDNETPKAQNAVKEHQSPAQTTVVIDEELEPLGNKIRASYAPRFPELASLVPDLQEFCAAVRVLGPGTLEGADEVPDQAALDAAVGKSRAMVVTMSLASTPGRSLNSSEWAGVNGLIETAETLLSQRKAATQVLAAELEAQAPNLLEIVQLATAVNLVAYRGGLGELASTPSANLVSLGAPKTPLPGSVAHQARPGFVYNDAILRGVPVHHKRQAVRLVCAKIVLAARVDLARGSRDGDQGRLWRSQIIDRLEKMSLAPLSAQERALPVPEDKVSKKRGGRRARRLKQQLTPTELQRQRDRLAFGSARTDYGT